MQAIYNFFAKPMGWLLSQFCGLLGGNFALSIFIFTLLINIVFLPLNIKQQKSMAGQARMKNKMDKIKEKYKDDRAAQQQAMGDLMQESGSNPMTGCLLMFIRLPFFVAIYTSVIQPLTFIVGATSDQISKATETLTNLGITISDQARTAEMQIMSNLDKLHGTAIYSEASKINFNFLGINLTESPELSSLSVIWLIPLLSFATSLLSTFVTTRMQKKTNPNAAQGMGCMYVFMPLFSLFIAFSVPGAVGFYWACSNLVSMFISVFTNKMFNPSRTVAQIEAKTVIKRMKYEEEKIAAALKRDESAQ